MEMGRQRQGFPDEPLHGVCVGKRPREADTHMSSGWADAETTGSRGEPVRKAQQLHSMLPKLSPLPPLSCSHFFLPLPYPFGKSRECHPSRGMRPTPTAPQFSRDGSPSGVTLALTILQSANDICILLAGESVGGGGVRSLGRLWPGGKSRDAGLGVPNGLCEPERAERCGIRRNK